MLEKNKQSNDKIAETMQQIIAEVLLFKVSFVKKANTIVAAIFCGQRLFGSIMKLVVALTVGLVKGVVGLFKKNETEV